jgi:hypothetical protein
LIIDLPSVASDNVTMLLLRANQFLWPMLQSEDVIAQAPELVQAPLNFSAPPGAL